jgi:hypothetical protein
MGRLMRLDRRILLALQPTVAGLVFGVVAACSSGDRLAALDAAAGPAAPDAALADAAASPAKGPPKKVYAKKFVVTVRETPTPDGVRLGYLRAGAVIQAKTAEPVARMPGCLAGFYELETGGFVCNVRDVLVFDGRRPPERPPAQPDREALLPYQYGINRRNDTPMYRRLPTDEEAAMYEGYRIPGLEVEAPVEGAEGQAPGAVPEGAAPIPESGLAAIAAANSAAATQAIANAADPAAAAEAVAEAALEPGQPTLASLQGERGTVLARRMVKGFYVSLDRDHRVRARRYWRSLSNGFIPHARIALVTGSSFHGVEFETRPPAEPGAPDAAAPTPTLTLPGGFVMNQSAVFQTKAEDGRFRRGPRAEYRSFVGIVGEETVRGTKHYLTNEGRYIRASDVRRIELSEPPSGTADDEKWLDVDLTTQTLVAYIGPRPVYATLVSSGKGTGQTDPLLNHETPTGDFRITSKHVATTMDGDHAVDGPYSIEDVPYVMYFQLAYALHSAFWHNRFGYPKSHGCINLAPTDARWVFDWATPLVPEGWHGAYPTGTAPGTRLIVHGAWAR